MEGVHNALPGDQTLGKRAAAAGQPERPRGHGERPIWELCQWSRGGSPVGKQTAAVRVTAAQSVAGNQEREVVGAQTTIRQRLESALGYSGRMESTVLLEGQETLDAELLQEEEAEAKAEAEKRRPGLTMLTDGPDTRW